MGRKEWRNGGKEEEGRREEKGKIEREEEGNAGEEKVDPSSMFDID